MPVLPFSNNIGPGNIPNPKGTNWVDEAAYQHDVAYGNAKSESEIRKADSDFLLKLTSQFDSNPLHSLHQLFGGIGIASKYAIESVAGVQYPSLMEVEEGENVLEPPPAQAPKRGNRRKEPGNSKKARVQDGDVSSSYDKTFVAPSKKVMQEEDESAGAHGTAGSKNHLDLLSNPCSRITGLAPFRTCKTFDLELVTFNPTLTLPNAVNPIGLWPAPLYSFAVEQLGWYLNRGEINMLNYINGYTQTITKCSGQISLGILNSPFVTQTASSNQTSANTNVNVQLQSGKGLEDNYIMFNGLGTLDYSSSTGDYPLSAWTTGLFDTQTLTDWDLTTSPPTLPATHVMRKYNQIVAFPAQLKTTTSASTINNTLAPPTYKDGMIRMIESTAGGVLTSWDYSPNCHFNLQNTPSAQWNGKINIGTDLQPASLVSETSTTNPLLYAQSNEAQSESSIGFTTAIVEDNVIRLGGRGISPRVLPAPHVIPREYIGFLPPTTVSGASVQPIKIAIQVKTEIEINLHTDLTYSNNASIAPYRTGTVSWPTAKAGNTHRFNAKYTSNTTDNWAGQSGLVHNTV